jgi:hypothetical protein
VIRIATDVPRMSDDTMLSRRRSGPNTISPGRSGVAHDEKRVMSKRAAALPVSRVAVRLEHEGHELGSVDLLDVVRAFPLAPPPTHDGGVEATVRGGWPLPSA